MSFHRMNTLGKNADGLLEMATSICRSSESLQVLDLHRIYLDKPQLQAIMEALLNNNTSTFKRITLTGNRTIGENQDLIELLKRVISNQKGLI